MNHGDRVMYSAKFLRSAGIYTGEAPFRKGTVTGCDGRVAHVTWDDGGESPALASNLVLVNRKHLEV